MNKQTIRTSPLIWWRASLIAAAFATVPPQSSFAQAPVADGETTFGAQHIQAPMLLTILPDYEELTGKKIIIENSINDSVTMTINTQQVMTRDEAIRFYEDSFLMNGFAILPVDDKTVKLVSMANKPPSGTGHVPIVREGEEIPDIDDTIIYIMKLTNVSAEEATRVFQLVTRSATGGFVVAPDGSTMIITESARTIRTVVDLKIDIDVPRGNLKQEAIQLLRADAEEVAASLNEILTAATSQRQRAGSGTPVRAPVAATSAAAAAAAAAPQQVIAAARGEIGALPDAASVHIHAISRINSVLVIARPIDFAYVKGLVEIFDAPNEIDNFLKRELKYLPVSDFLPLAENALSRYQDGARAQGGGVGSALGGSRTSTANRTSTTRNNRNSTGNSNFGGGGGGGGGGLGSGSLGSPQELSGPESLLIGNTLLIGDSQLNNVIVSGPPEHLRIIDQLLDEIDIRPRQVYISAVIAQVSLGDDLRFGMDILRTVETVRIGGTDVDIAGLYRTATGGSTILDPTTLDLVENFPDTAEGFNVWAQIGTFLHTYVEALENTSRFQVLSRPFVFTANNKVANIASGERVAVPTNTTSSLNSTDTINSSIGFEEVLLELEVIPLINSSDEVTLEIFQQNENIIGFTTISNNRVPNIATQSLNTTVRLPNKGIVVLGGIIQDDITDNVNGLPFLSKIPILKRLTGSTSLEKNRRELLIFLQPHIIEGSTDLIDANIDKISQTVVGEDALDVGKPDAAIEPALFPDLKKPRRVFPRKEEQPIESSSYDEPALPQHGPAPASIEPTPTPAVKKAKPRKKLFNFKFGEGDKTPDQGPAKEKRGIFGRRRK